MIELNPSNEAVAEQQQTLEDQKYNSSQLIIFKLGNEEYAFHISQIKEVVITPNITKMPQTHSYIKGVANIRGNIIAIVDLEEKLNIDKNEGLENYGHYTLVVESDQLKIGILSTEVPNTLTVPDSSIEETSNLVQSDTGSGYIKGIVKLDERLIILIDVFKVISENDLKNIG